VRVIESVTKFNRAIVRRPSSSVVHGLRAGDQEDPDADALQEEHRAYVQALESAGVEVTVLPALEEFPDSTFVEDPALVFADGAILLRPGASSRRGEVAEIEPTLRTVFSTVLSVPESGFSEGGDVLVTPDEVLIGVSARTNEEGAEALIARLEELGRSARIVHTPPDVLHFKTDCSLLDDETVFATKRLAASGVFSGLKTVLVPDGEEAAANALRVNDVVLVGSRYKRSIDLLDGLGHAVVPLKTTEIGKIDAGLSCMSLRWLA